MASEILSCPACNEELSEDSIYCIQCGTNVFLVSKQEFEASMSVSTIELSADLIQQYNRLKAYIHELADAEELVENQEKHLRALEHENMLLGNKVQKAKVEKMYEEKDVERLKKLSWGSIKARVKGEYSNMLSKEESEYFEAVNVHETLSQQKKIIEEQLIVAKKQFEQAKELLNKKNEREQELKQLIRRIGRQIVDPKVIELEEEHSELEAELKQLNSRILDQNNCLSHANNASSCYSKAAKKLAGAQNMSTWDVLGGGLVADSMKHSRLGEASGFVSMGNSELRRAVEGLTNYTENQGVKVEELGFWGDVVFDNIFSDMAASGKIAQSQNSVQKGIDHARQVAHWIKVEIRELEGKIAKINERFIPLDEKLELMRVQMIEEHMEQAK
ncbi:MAG: hypothetical protein ACW99A_18890 [Candidatus Kariarchaeaceae archaeon]|jgi:hypothetical protein